MAEEKILERVRKLLDRAQHPNTPPAEAESCINKADALMMKHAIDQAILDSSKRDDQRTPIVRRFRAYQARQWASLFGTIMAAMEDVTRCRTTNHYNGDVTVVGMSDDVDYYETLWTTIYLDFISKMDPKWNNDLEFDHNVFNFKKSGFSWPQIRDLATRAGHTVPWPDGGLLIRAAKRHAKATGDTLPKTQRHAAYRESFAEGFTRSVCSRMRDQRMDNERMASQSGSGAELALVSVQERVDEMYYQQFEFMRPLTEEEKAKQRAEITAKRAREAAELEARLNAMTPKERAAYDAEQERIRRKEARENDLYWKQQERDAARAYDSDGMAAGRRAGEAVNLGGRGGVSTNQKRGELG